MGRSCVVLFILVCMITGCQKQDDELQRVLLLRQQLLTAEGCSFSARVRADYGEFTYAFALTCEADKNGNLTFCVLEPEGIAGITGTFRANGGTLTFQDAVLAFPTLADGEVSPVSAPWLFIQTLIKGYIETAGKDGDLLRVTIHDSYEDNALQLDIWLDASNRPVEAQILWQGRSVLTVFVENFEIL